MSVSTSAIDELAARFWEVLLEADPLQATVVGEHRYDDRLPDLTPEARESQLRTLAALRVQADHLVPDPGLPEEMLTLSALRWSLDAKLAQEEANASAYTVDVTWGLQWHFEIDRGEIETWLDAFSAEADLLSTWGKTPEAVRSR